MLIPQIGIAGREMNIIISIKLKAIRLCCKLIVLKMRMDIFSWEIKTLTKIKFFWNFYFIVYKIVVNCTLIKIEVVCLIKQSESHVIV